MRVLRENARAFFDWVVGFILIVAGIICWIIPIIPGWPLILPGLALWSRRCRALRKLVLRAKRQAYRGRRSWRRRRRARRTR